MYGFIAKIRTMRDKRDAAIAILTNGSTALPGCLAYIVAKDRADPDVIWITEAWDNEKSHRAALSLPVVKQAIAEAKPFIAGFETQIPIEPIGGLGLDLTV